MSWSPSLTPDESWTFSPTTDMYAASVSSSPSSLVDETDAAHAASLALRRQRNRESMRRTRQRAKETLTTLRTTVARLESQYAMLLAAPEADASSTSLERREFIERLQSRLLSLVQMRRTLESENGAVLAQIQQRQALERELQQILNDNELDAMINEKLALLGGDGTLPPKPDPFTPLTPMEVQDVIATFCRERDRIQESTVSATSETLEVFGWRTHRHIDATTNEMHFEFIKQFDHLTANDMTQRAWSQAMDLARFRRSERELQIRRLEFLQHITNEIKVMVRETVHPTDGTVFRTNYLVFKIPIRRPTGDGIRIGMRSVNPPAVESETAASPPERVVWIDVSVSIEIVSCGPDTCYVSWCGRTNYHSPQYAAENAIKFLMGVLRWEQGIVGPLIQLY